MNSPGLATEFCLQRLVYYRFVTPVQVARAARRQDDSGLFPGLEESKAPHPEREEKADPPRPGGAGRDHPESDYDARRKRAGTHDQPPPPLSRPDIDGSAARHLEQVPKLFDGYPGLAKNPMEDLRLERTAGMEGHDNFLSRVLTMPKCNVAPDLMIAIPSCPAEGSN